MHMGGGGGGSFILPEKVAGTIYNRTHGVISAKCIQPPEVHGCRDEEDCIPSVSVLN